MDDDYPDFQQTYGQREQMGGKNAYIGTFLTKSMRAGMAPSELFMSSLEQHAHLFSIKNINLNDIASILPLIPHIEHKNPIAFLLGFYSITPKKKIDTATIDEFIQTCQEKEIKNITKADIVRYARLIQRFI
jgi:hypothetical protein